MRKVALVLFSVAGTVCAMSALASSISYQKQIVLSTPVNAVYVDLNDHNVKVTVAISRKGRGSSEVASSIISRTHPKAAITGTFFDTHSLLPTGDIVIGGVRAHSGCVGAALCITADNFARIIPHNRRALISASAYDTVLAGGPTLVDGGRVAMNPRSEGFHDPALFRSTRRTAVGLTAENRLLFVSVNSPISMRRLANIMVHLRCDQAIMLDGGSSTALYTNGKFVSKPVRRLTNLLVAYDTQSAYQLAAGKLAPTIISADQIIASAPSPEKDVTISASIAQPDWHNQLTDRITSASQSGSSDAVSLWNLETPTGKTENPTEDLFIRKKQTVR